MKKTILFALDKILSYKDALYLSTVIMLFSLFRIPSLVEPYWYGDEGIYQVIGVALRQGRALYSGIWDNKPPFLYLIYSLFNGDLFYVRFASLVFGALSILLFFLLAKKLFKNPNSSYVSTFIFALFFGLPVIEGNIANAENFMLLPIITAFYLIFSAKQKTRILYSALSGLLLSTAFLFKIVAIFDFAALLVTILILRFYEAFSLNPKKIKKEIPLILSSLEQEFTFIFFFITPIIFTAVYYLIVNSFPDFYKAVFSQNVGYVGYKNFFLFPMGFLFLKIGLLLFALSLIARYRKSLTPSGVLIFIWVLFSLFNAMFSQRPYIHYVLTLLPAFCLLIGWAFENKKSAILAIPLAGLLLFLIFQNFKFYTKIIPYYNNYLSFIFNGRPIDEYEAFFDKNTPADYAISRFIKMKTKPSENVFLWSDSGQIYALSEKLPPGRYIVSYHMTFYKDAILETKKAIDDSKPKYIIQTKEASGVENFLDNYELKYKMKNVKIYERQS